MKLHCVVFFIGFGSSGMDYGMVGGKETGTESRFKQWTSMMDGLPSVASQDANMHKNGETLNYVARNRQYAPHIISLFIPTKYLLD